MNRFFTFLLLGLTMSLSALADTYVNPSQIEPHWGFIRQGRCANGSGDNCGDDPPTWHLTPDQCGTLQSTSNARNSNGTTVSSKGVRYTLPTTDEFVAAGYSSAGLTGSTNRQGQCAISFVMGLPAPENYLRLGVVGVQNSDRITFYESGSFRDLFYGEVVFPMVNGVVTAIWNGTSWLIYANSPNMSEIIHQGQQQTNGSGRLFLVTADPSWWTVGTRVGTLAYCPHNGRSTTTEDNGYTSLHMYSINCVYKEAGVGSSNEAINLRYIGNSSTSAIAAGDAYGSGTAPNGVAYAAGNYAVLSITSSVGLVSGATVRIDNLPTTLGGRYLLGKWIVKVVTAGATGCPAGTCIELHESVDDANSQAVSSVGPPSAFLAGDSISSTVTTPLSVSYYLLTGTSLATGVITNTTTGMETEASSRLYGNVGFARKVGSVYLDSATLREVVSRFNPMEKECRSTTGADRTTTSLTFVTLNADSLCTFIAMNHSSTQAKLLGDVGRGVRWVLTITAANNTANDGCEVGVGFDGTTAEPTIGRIMNGANVEGAKSITISGIKTGLSETTTHTIQPVIRAVTGGTCTFTASATTLSAFIWQ